MSVAPAPRRAAAGLLALAALALAPAARAAGGAHIVDDANVEAAGGCQVVATASAYGGRRGLGGVSGACTPAARPRLELGVAASHLLDAAHDTQAGPAAKLNLRPTETGLGLGLAASSGWSLRSGRLETVSVVVPASIALGEAARLNLNAGWTYARLAPHPHAVFYGAQVEADLARGVTLVAEAFGRGHGHPGAQAGVRWTLGDGRLEIDLLAGRRTDGVNRSAVTLGLTVHR